MKIPALGYKVGVQSLGRQSPTGPVAAANAFAQAVGAGAELLSEIADRHDEAAVQDAAVNARAELDLTHAKIASQPAFNPLEIPSGIKYRRDETVVDGNGNINTRLREVIPASEVMLELWKQQSERITRAHGSNLTTARQKDAYNRMMQEQVARLSPSMNDAYVRRYSVTQQARSLHNAQVAEKSGNSAGAVAIVAASPHLAPRAKVEEIAAIQTRAELKVYNNTASVAKSMTDTLEDWSRAAEMGVDAGPMPVLTEVGVVKNGLEQEIAMLRSPDYSGNLSEKQRLALADDLDRTHDALLNSVVRSETASRGNTARQLEHDIYRGYREVNGQKIMAGKALVEQAFAANQITAPKYVSLMKMIEGRDAFENNLTQAQVIVDAAVANNIPLNPGEKKDRDTVDTFYGTPDTSTTEGRAQALEAGTVLSVQTNVMPSRFKGDLQRYAQAGDRDTVIAASKAYTQLVINRPAIVNQLDAETRTVLGAVDVLSRGMPIEEAAEQVMRNVRGLSAEERTAVLATYKPADDTLDNYLDADDAFDIYTWSGGAPDAVARMRVQFEKSRREAFLATRSTKAADRIAWNTVRGTWATTEINSEVDDDAFGSDMIMAYAPELLYPDFTADEWQSDRRAFAAVSAIDPDKLVIQSDNRTGLDGSYAAYTITPTGALAVTFDDQNQEIRYIPRITEARATEMAEREAERAQKALERAARDEDQMVQVPEIDIGDVTRKNKPKKPEKKPKNKSGGPPGFGPGPAEEFDQVPEVSL